MESYTVTTKDGRVTIVAAYTESDAFQKAADFAGGDIIETMEQN